MTSCHENVYTVTSCEWIGRRRKKSHLFCLVDKLSIFRSKWPEKISPFVCWLQLVCLDLALVSARVAIGACDGVIPISATSGLASSTPGESRSIDFFPTGWPTNMWFTHMCVCVCDAYSMELISSIHHSARILVFLCSKKTIPTRQTKTNRVKICM